MARSRTRSIWSFARIDQTFFGRSGGFAPVSLPSFHSLFLLGTGGESVGLRIVEPLHSVREATSISHNVSHDIFFSFRIWNGYEPGLDPKLTPG